MRRLKMATKGTTMTTEDQRALEKFVRQCCHVHPLAKVTRKALFSAYIQWRAAQGKVPLSAQDFTGYIRAIADIVERQVYEHGSSRYGWRGISLKRESN